MERTWKQGNNQEMKYEENLKIQTSTEEKICEGKCRQLRIFDGTSQKIWMRKPNEGCRIGWKRGW